MPTSDFQNLHRNTFNQNLQTGNVLTTESPATTQPTPTYNVLPGNCTFETGTCDWTSENDGDWVRQTGTSADGVDNNQGVSLDHTTNGAG